VKFLVLFLHVLAWTGSIHAKETPAADCKYLLMKPEAVRESLRAMIQAATPGSSNERKERAAELKAAANVLLGHSSFSDMDVQRAFQVARELIRDETVISNFYPLTVGSEAVAQFKTKDLGQLGHRFPQLILRAYPVYRLQNMEKPVAYLTKIILDVGEADTELFKHLFNERAFLHDSISASLKSHREDLIVLSANLVRRKADRTDPPGRMRAVLISPVVTDSFAYTHAEFRRLNRNHQNFLSFFKEMERYPDEVIYEIMHMIGVMTDHSRLEN
jgi:hypothetical protein